MQYKNNFSIPVINFSEIVERTPRSLEEMGDALKSVGFFALKNHPLDLKLVEECYTVGKNLFDEPEDYKKELEVESLKGQRGYTSFGKEHAKNSTNMDLKEFYHVGREEFSNDFPKPNFTKNIWPNNKVEGFTNKFSRLYKELDLCSIELLKSCALYLKQPEDCFSKWTENGNSILRVIHYPKVETPGECIRAAAHEDINLITLLLAATADGLQIQINDGTWVNVITPPDCIIVDSGDMLQNWTNGYFKATTHRVVNPSDEKKNISRYSMPFFCHPRPECPLNPLKSLVELEGKILYPDIMANDFLMKRLEEIGY